MHICYVLSRYANSDGSDIASITDEEVEFFKTQFPGWYKYKLHPKVQALCWEMLDTPGDNISRIADLEEAFSPYLLDMRTVRF